ncbi:MAG: DUF3127 domain-containing protein [Bacteroidetes bacterium]|jgi:hypothetical protein|nr:MAG: DUF3127 domain-containing protein [Bacteroidota bacterium]
MAMTVRGKLHKKFPTVDVSDRFRKREFVIEIVDGNPMYPQYVTFQLTQDKCGVIEDVPQGSTLDVDFNLRGREWKSPQGEIKYFNTLEAWRVVTAAAESSPAMEAPLSPPPYMSGSDLEGGADDLPF